MQKHIQQFFKFLQDKEGKPAPLRLKILDPQTFGKPTKEDLIVKGGLDLSETDIKELPQGLQVYGDLFLDRCTSLKELPKGLQVGENLFLLNCTSLEKLPQDLKVEWSLLLGGCTSLKELPQGLEVDYLSLYKCTSLKELPQGLEVRETLNLHGCTSLTKLPQGLRVGWDLDLINTPIAQKYSEEQIRKMIKDGGGFVKRKIIM